MRLIPFILILALLAIPAFAYYAPAPTYGSGRVYFSYDYPYTYQNSEDFRVGRKWSAPYYGTLGETTKTGDQVHFRPIYNTDYWEERYWKEKDYQAQRYRDYVRYQAYYYDTYYDSLGTSPYYSGYW
ncbi:hypothetical protein HZB01_01380 [Candidatus Woesearchaeota archaeon]|nr:hypothetical protein [Candidatus Woesearchaeota archaeon]